MKLNVNKKSLGRKAKFVNGDYRINTSYIQEHFYALQFMNFQLMMTITKDN